jgi:hypothetical protein
MVVKVCPQVTMLAVLHCYEERVGGLNPSIRLDEEVDKLRFLVSVHGYAASVCIGADGTYLVLRELGECFKLSNANSHCFLPSLDLQLFDCPQCVGWLLFVDMVARATPALQPDNAVCALSKPSLSHLYFLPR